uniref:Interleukin 17d n=1 Tax=Oryzias latipes TaxID=8090 RepID=A0A3B3HBS3_ORYLA
SFLDEKDHLSEDLPTVLHGLISRVIDGLHLLLKQLHLLSVLDSLLDLLLTLLHLSLFHVFFRISYDPTRYPRSIPEAYCLCKGCLIGPSGEESRQYRSTPVYSPSVILRRTGSCAGGRHSYSEIYVSIAVGCTCVPLLEKNSIFLQEYWKCL